MDAILPGVGDTLNEPDMRYEQEPLSADVEMTDDDARETDVLRNLVASEALQPKRGVSDDPLDELDEFADADDEQPTKKQRPRAQRTFPLGRLLAAVLLIAAVILPFFVDFGFGGDDGPPAAFVEGGDAAAVFEYLGTLAPRDIVLFSVDYSPTHAAELDPIFQTTVRHTLARGAFPVFVGRNPVGVSRVEDLMAEIASDETFTDAVGGEPTFNQDYFVVGYLPGDNAALRELVASPGDVLANNVRGGQTGLDSLNSLDDLARIVLLAGTPENVRDWSEQVAPQTTTPLVAGVGAVSEDLSRQYLNAPDGLEGLLVSIEDAAVYNQLLGDQVLPDASTLGSLPTATYTPSITPVISLTPSSTPTLTPIGFQATDTPPDFTPSPPPPEFDPYSVYGVGTFVTAGGGALNVRDEPSINGGLVGVLSPGDFAPVLAEVENDAGEPWTQVLLPEGERGWVASDLLRAANETEAATATADFQPPAATSVAEQPTDTPTEPPTATATATSTPTATATATEPPTETATPTVGSMVQGGDDTETVPGVESMLDEDGNVLPGLETMVDESGNLRPGVESMLDEDGGLIPEAQATVDAAVAQATENAATEEATDAPTQTAEPTATGEPTDTPAPTSTELPTDTPSPSPTPEVLEAGTTVQTSPRTAINVRNGPSTDAERITALRPSTLLQVIGSDESGQWVEVALPDGQTGFIFRELLTVRPEVDAPTLAPSVTPSEPPTEPPTSTPTVTPIPLDAEGLVAVISGSVPVNVRTGPSRAFQPIRPLQPGDVVNLIAPSEDERWLEVQLPDGETGFIIATAAEVVLGETYFEQATATAEAGGQAQLPATDAPDAPTSAPAAEEGTPGRQSLPDGSTVSPRGFEGVNVRGEPARFAPVVGVIPAQSTAPALLRSADGAWIQVELENDTLGWVAASVVTLEIPADAETDADESNETAYRYTPRRYRRPAREYRPAPRRQTDTEGLGVIIASGVANVRSGPGLSFDVVGVAQPEATVDVISLTDEGGGWAQIRLPNGVEGYISQSLVDIQLMPMATDTNQPDDTNQPTATPTDPPATPGGLDQDGLARVTATGTVNVREEASINAAVVGLVDPGEEVPLLALPESDNGTAWAQIRLGDGTVGFISASLLEVLIPPAEPGEQPPTPTATAANTDTPTATFTPSITTTPRTTPTRTPPTTCRPPLTRSPRKRRPPRTRPTSRRRARASGRSWRPVRLTSIWNRTTPATSSAPHSRRPRFRCAGWRPPPAAKPGFWSGCRRTTPSAISTPAT